MKVKIKVDGAKYFLCKSCGVYKKDKFDGKIKNQKFCVPCLRNFSIQKPILKNGPHSFSDKGFSQMPK